MTTKISIKATDQLNNVAYIKQTRNGEWSCVLGNGIPAAPSYAGIRTKDEVGFYLALSKIDNAEEALKHIIYEGGQSYRYEIADYGILTPAEKILDRLASEFGQALDEDEPIDGTDAVDFLSQNWEDIKIILGR